MSRTLFWKPHTPNEMKGLTKCVPLMDAIENIFGCEKVVLDDSDIHGLYWLSQGAGPEDCHEIGLLIILIKEHGAIEIEIRR